MILGRFLPIIGPVAIAGLLAQKKYIPESAGTLKNRYHHLRADDLRCNTCVKRIIVLPCFGFGPYCRVLFNA
jgi:K+-transporting ATPase ATPase A chain